MVALVLIIDPDEVERRRLRRALADAGLNLAEAKRPIEGLSEAMERDPDLILLAEQVPPLEGRELLLVLRRITDAPVIIIGSGDEPEELDVLDLGADFYLRRPFDPRTAVARARALLRRRGCGRSGSQNVLVRGSEAGEGRPPLVMPRRRRLVARPPYVPGEEEDLPLRRAAG